MNLESLSALNHANQDNWLQKATPSNDYLKFTFTVAPAGVEKLVMFPKAGKIVAVKWFYFSGMYNMIDFPIKSVKIIRINFIFGFSNENSNLNWFLAHSEYWCMVS